MTNNEIAQFLYEIYQMLDIKGESRFRITAYRNAARAVEHLSSDLEDIYKEKGVGGLEQIRGIGQSIALKIAELLETGKCQYYDDLIKDIPKAELALMKVPGVGPKTAKKLYEDLNIQSLIDLEKAARKGLIRKLEGFDVKAEKNILKNISRIKKIEKRMLISFARPLAEEVLFYLKESCPHIKKADIVGSLRRWRETIGDIDLVAASDKPEVVIDCFVKFPKTKEIISRGSTKASILHRKGNTQIDLEVLRPSSYGSLLQHLTGSREHNVALRRYANELGFSLSEYGILNLKTKKREFFSNEVSFYKKLNLNYIEPELRENRGEIEKAIHNDLPKLIETFDVKGCLHIHTNWSEGSLTIEEVVQETIKRGYHYLVICDHTAGLGVARGMNEQALVKQIQKIREINQKLNKKNFRVLTGVEVNIKADGTLDIKDKILEKLDVVVASIHSGFTESEQQITARLLSAIKNPHVDIIGHPSGRILLKRVPYDVEWPKVFQECRKTNTALEINCHPERLDLSDDLIFEARKYGVSFVISLDAHNLEHFDLLKYGVAMARRGWLSKEEVINTRPLEGFLKFWQSK